MTGQDHTTVIKPQVVVCICTYRRPDGLARLLDGLIRQVSETAPPDCLDIIVVDNDGAAGNALTKAVCDTHAMQFRALRYIVEPEPGISHARNAAVDNIPASADFVALIDDDEVPEPRWIQSLLDAQRATDADIITGPTLPVFPADTPAWIIHSGYFCKPRYAGNLKNLQSDPPTASCNVMLRASLFTREKFRFDPALAFSGGEDKLLFQNLKLQGFRFTWAADAMVHETIPEERATLAYMLREEYRRGTVKHYVKMRLKADSSARKLRITARTASRALLRLILSTGQFMICKLINRRDKISGTLAALAVADAAGTLAGTLGIRRRHYRS